MNCLGVMGHDCGHACAASDESCTHNVLTIIEGFLAAAVDTTILALSFGSSASLKMAASAASKATLKSAAEKNMRRVAIRVSQKQFKDEYKNLARKAAMKAVQDAIQTRAQDHAINKGVELSVNIASNETASAMVSAADMAELAAEELAKMMQDENKNFDVMQLDFTGITGVIDAMQNDKSDAEKAYAWLNMLGTFDPTGLLAAAANLAKPLCSDIYEEIEKADVQPSNPNDRRRRSSSSGPSYQGNGGGGFYSPPKGTIMPTGTMDLAVGNKAGGR